MYGTASEIQALNTRLIVETPTIPATPAFAMAGAPDLHPVPEEAYDASDEKQIKERENKAAVRERQSRQVVADLLANTAGRTWMWTVLSDCNAFSQSFVPGEADSTAFNEGKRSVGNRLIAEVMRVDPSLYLKMLEENGKA